MRWLAVAASVMGVVAVRLAIAAPTGWRSPTPAEVGQSWRKDSPHRYLAISADFDGDGKADRAELLVQASGSGAALVVTLARASKKPMILERLEDASWLDVMGIDVVAPGEYPTACGKGYWACGPGEPDRLKLERPGIDFFKVESANSFFVFDTKTQVFQRVWMSD
jgi:hypothetical protein